MGCGVMDRIPLLNQILGLSPKSAKYLVRERLP